MEKVCSPGVGASGQQKVDIPIQSEKVSLPLLQLLSNQVLSGLDCAYQLGKSINSNTDIFSEIASQGLKKPEAYHFHPVVKLTHRIVYCMHQQ